MKTKKLLSRLRDFLNAERSEQEKEMDSIRLVLRELREKQRKFQAKLDENPNRDDREEIEGKLRAIRAQRQKGVERLRVLSGRQDGFQD
ncbi:hypothetical protein ACN2MM_14295 [Alkalilimnicola ehrlichii MLHE-1]|uniref:Uncharacterized protein n=1 Tax=Alkalilimnicola ehrlichii (strain ATCC BAA-1101 / DSM 17681 / MLHE-1) TaxID=187272 RepID=Q0A547_ALKEH|nr:hypothetical protein [Alkalilimnicola ehrlichii]ABI58040.1 hypothetical protein Mlg_2700 [Alkalilimnicola ehrlichii MLHE-1]